MENCVCARVEQKRATIYGVQWTIWKFVRAWCVFVIVLFLHCFKVHHWARASCVQIQFSVIHCVWFFFLWFCVWVCVAYAVCTSNVSCLCNCHVKKLKSLSKLFVFRFSFFFSFFFGFFGNKACTLYTWLAFW